MSLDDQLAEARRPHAREVFRRARRALYFQNASPGAEKEANWLPAPKGAFLPMLRMYWPKENDPSILNGSWKPPAVVKTN